MEVPAKEMKFRQPGAKGLDKWRWFSKFPPSSSPKEKLQIKQFNNHFARAIWEGRVVPAPGGHACIDPTDSERLPNGWQYVPEEMGPGPLPEGWEATWLKDRVMFIDHVEKTIGEDDPRDTCSSSASSTSTMLDEEEPLGPELDDVSDE